MAQKMGKVRSTSQICFSVHFAFRCDFRFSHHFLALVSFSFYFGGVLRERYFADEIEIPIVFFVVKNDDAPVAANDDEWQ